MSQPNKFIGNSSFIWILFVSLHLKNHQNFKGDMTNEYSIVRTVVPTRTFLEKLFLLAEEFQKEKPRSVRMSRHLYDLEKLMDTEYGKEALSNRELYDAIVEHRKAYYALKYVNYDSHTPSSINFTTYSSFCRLKPFTKYYKHKCFANSSYLQR